MINRLLLLIWLYENVDAVDQHIRVGTIADAARINDMIEEAEQQRPNGAGTITRNGMAGVDERWIRRKMNGEKR